MEGMMSEPNEPARARFESREQSDLRKQYRPIGIGAVAAALAVTANDQDNGAQAARDEGKRMDAENGGRRYSEPMAA
jgi:hypothetical protein